ncbi:Lon protease family protein [Psychrobacter phenylpyruvicus]|uniref:endopeptidase La n=2 Tax=Psychrobacter phenylpyruvicus TaxID=29432 RepID=A0A379LKI9_9GAMM|nr:AAA family ATPase [Psychrobacter phenylpyruvicus]SUD90941.1 ATP-dependent protease Lon [Psychrobacter phenylpyruvicus]
MSFSSNATNPKNKAPKSPHKTQTGSHSTSSDLNSSFKEPYVNANTKKLNTSNQTMTHLTKQQRTALATKTVTQIKHNCKVDSVKLKKHSDPSVLPASTKLAARLNCGFGQQRSISALNTAFDITAGGYNVFAVGANGLGKRTFITQYLCNKGHKQTLLKDWIYGYNFNCPNSPLAIALEPGTAPKLSAELVEIWHHLTAALMLLDNNGADQTRKDNKKSDLAQNYLAQKANNTAAEVIAPYFVKLVDAYSSNAKLVGYLQLLQQDLIINAQLILQAKDPRFVPAHNQQIPDRYNINIISSVGPKSHSEYALKQNQTQTPDGAPIVFEPNPCHSNLLGKINQTLQTGCTISNHMMIQPGALHRANGGFLIIEASHISEYPEAWHGLKLALRTAELSPIEVSHNTTLGDNLLTPEPIPLENKIILLGESDLYDQYAEQDGEFLSLFKIRADFHEEVVRSIDNELEMVAKMADIIAKYKIKHFDSSAQAAVLEFLSLLSEDQNKLSLHSDSLIQVMLEADRLATKDQAELVTYLQVKQAINDISFRSSYLKELYLQEITDGQQLISTTGSAIGQINALTIIDYADSEFGMPALLTAVVQHSVGSGDILDIERDVELGGSLHAKGMLIMNSYLRALFSPYHPLNFTASLAFEQSYAHIDGDSATLAEACALLSALAEVPISQALGITGSMNQLGRVQAVGGINAKVAGFFDACSHQGLTGEQGVILPYANISQLMLRDDIIEAVKAKKFHIYGVKSLSEALTILADMPVDTINKKGRYRKASLFGKIIKNLKKWEEQLNPPEEPDDLEQTEQSAVKETKNSRHNE